MTENKCAKELLNGVWNGDLKAVRKAISEGADPNWIFNGFPILLHAVARKNEEMMMLLIEEGATQISEALGFALNHGIVECIGPLVCMGIQPKDSQIQYAFGALPKRHSSIGIFR